MLTRLEVRGFKNLRDVSVDFGPFTCIAGPNGVGKSNVFDAIQFLAELADRPLMEAAEAVRGTRGEMSADPRDLFWDPAGGMGQQMSFAAEMIVPHEIEDDFGQHAPATTTFLRYELKIGYEEPSGLERRGRLMLLGEGLKHITQSDATRHIKFPHSASLFRRKVVTGRRGGVAYISTSDAHPDADIIVHQDGGSRGRPRHASATRAASTVVRTISVRDDPTILAARREMQSWRRLSLEPSALRTEDRYNDARVMSSDGRHMPATLYRLATTKQNGDLVDAYAQVASRLRHLSGLDVDRVFVDADDTRELLTLRLAERSGRELPARSLSEGTLRFLALCILHEDATVGGLICMEEPENGINPANIDAMVNLVRDLAVDPNDEPGPNNPLRQVIVNTHSPAVVQLVGEDDLLMASTDTVISEGIERHALKLRPVTNSWRSKLANAEPVGKADLIPYLTNPVGSQLSLAS
ncbi:MAG: AAA family ATPase [Solirubrobacteraceae bacterium]